MNKYYTKLNVITINSEKIKMYFETKYNTNFGIAVQESLGINNITDDVFPIYTGVIEKLIYEIVSWDYDITKIKILDREVCANNSTNFIVELI